MAKTQRRSSVRMGRIQPNRCELIEDLNVLPPDLTLLTISDAEALLRWKAKGSKSPSKSEILDKCIEHVADQAGVVVATSLRERISKLASTHSDPDWYENEQLYAYEFFRLARLNFQSLARMNKLIRPRMKERGFDSVAVNAVMKEWYGDALGSDEIERVKECEAEKCGKVFWALRKDQKCCSVECNHRRHSARTRKKYNQGYYQGARLTKRELNEESTSRRSRGRKETK